MSGFFSRGWIGMRCAALEIGLGKQNVNHRLTLAPWLPVRSLPKKCISLTSIALPDHFIKWLPARTNRSICSTETRVLSRPGNHQHRESPKPDLEFDSVVYCRHISKLLHSDHHF
jgi:hypothetical protein